jgi:hypothetical protein
MSLTDRTACWVHDNSDRLRAIGQLTFRRSDDDRPKTSVHLVIAAEPRFAGAIIWDSGEVELSYGTADDPHDEHHELDDPEDLESLLESLVVRLER